MHRGPVDYKVPPDLSSGCAQVGILLASRITFPAPEPGTAVSEDSWHPLPEGITHENGHGDVAIAPRPAVGSDPTEGRSGEQNQREERHEKRD